MIQYFRYLFILFLFSLCFNQSEKDSLVKFPSSAIEGSNYNQLNKKSNDHAIQNETQIYFVDTSSISVDDTIVKSFLNFKETLSYAKEIFLSNLNKLKEKKSNSTLLHFPTIEIIYPFHSFW